jgi:FkbM family methyltransferase
VLAFEPESQNYAILNTNVLINDLQDRVSCYCIAVADRLALDHLYLRNFGTGGSLNNFGESRDYQDRPFSAEFRQGSIGVPLDELCTRFGLPVPQHIKIDVDGIEDKIVAGAGATFADPRVRSVLIEINTNLDAHWEIVDRMLEYGFDYSQEEVARAQRQEGPFQGVGNYVFRR